MKLIGFCKDKSGRTEMLYEENGRYYRTNPPKQVSIEQWASPGLEEPAGSLGSPFDLPATSAPAAAPPPASSPGPAVPAGSAALTVLSYGGGQDSTAILYKLFLDPEWRKKYVKGDLLILMSNTGCEHPETYKYVEHIKKFVEQQNGNFVFLDASMGYHSPPWTSLTDAYKKYHTIGIKGNKTCTGRLKIQPIYRFLDAYIGQNYLGWKDYKWVPRQHKLALLEFAKRYGKVRVIIGFAKGEERRVGKPEGDKPWQRAAIEKVYPLITEGVDRLGTIEIIKSYNQPVPLPSNCMLCHFMDPIELLWLHRNYPEKFQEWVEYENDKFKYHPQPKYNYDEWMAIAKEKGFHVVDINGLKYAKLPDGGYIGKYTPGTSHVKLGEGFFVKKPKFGHPEPLRPPPEVGVSGNKKRLPQVLAEAQAKYGHMTDKEIYDYKLTHGHNITTSY